MEDPVIFAEADRGRLLPGGEMGPKTESARILAVKHSGVLRYLLSYEKW